MKIDKKRKIKDTCTTTSNINLNIYNEKLANSICVKEGFNESVCRRIKNRQNTLDHIWNIREELKSLFESFGFGPEDVIEYINDNPNVICMDKVALKYNISLLDYAGVLEKTIFELPHLLYKNHDPNELYAIIKWLRDSEDNTSLEAEEINYYLTYLNRADKQKLKELYPFTKKKSGLILSRHDLLENSRIRENREFVKSLK